MSEAVKTLRDILKLCRTDHAREHGLSWDATRLLALGIEDVLKGLDK